MLRAAGFVLVAVLLILAPAGCGTDLDAATSYEPLTKKAFAKEMAVSMRDRNTVHMEMELEGNRMSLDARYGNRDELAVSGTFEEDGETSEVIVVDSVVYVRAEDEAKYLQLPDDLARLVMDEIDTSNPKALADHFKTGMATFEYAGAELVDGTELHRYDITMKKDWVAREVKVPAAKVPEFEYQVWMDEANLPRRVGIAVMGEDVAVELTGWGEPVTIEAPAPAQVEVAPSTAG